MKEKLAYCMWKRLSEENKDQTPLAQIQEKASSMDGDAETDAPSTNNTPKSKSLTEESKPEPKPEAAF